MTLPLAPSQLEAITAACRQHHVSRLHAFGSVLRSDYLPGESDIDLLVEFEPLEPTALVEAYFGLEQQLAESIGPAVDLVMATAIHNSIVRSEIDASKQLVYAA
jgi:predicted nucleotidyltransferase